MDRIGIHILVFICTLVWFVLQWGLCAAAIAAGLSFFILVTIMLHKIRDGRLIRKEKGLRIRIGGEMALERLLTADEARAHFEIALLLSMHHPLTMIKSTEAGTLCTLRGEYVLIHLSQCPLTGQIIPDHVLSLQRQMRRLRAHRGILCAPCAISSQAREQARGEYPVTFYNKEQLISLLGAANPATDSQLIALGKRKKKRAPLNQWMQLILDPRRFSRYGCYGLLLIGLYLLTRLPYYILPGLLCLLLAAACRCKKERKESL